MREIQVIESLELVGDGKPVVIRLGLPYERPTGEWACTMLIEGLLPGPREIYGVDPAQAQQLAARVVQTVLVGAVERGMVLEHDGVRLDASAVRALVG